MMIQTIFNALILVAICTGIVYCINQLAKKYKMGAKEK